MNAGVDWARLTPFNFRFYCGSLYNGKLLHLPSAWLGNSANRPLTTPPLCTNPVGIARNLLNNERTI